MQLLKEFTKDLKIPIRDLFAKALQYTQVTNDRLRELEIIYGSSKNKKRVLFVKDHDKNITYLKSLPNLPDDEQMTECNVEDDS